MSNATSLISRLEERQQRTLAFQQARRMELDPLKAERVGLVTALEREITVFLRSALTDLKPETLAPFDAAAKAAHSEVIPSTLAESLARQSQRAEALCQRYEKEFNIYQLAEQLPEMDTRVSESKARLSEAQRELDRLEIRLEPLLNLNIKLSARNSPPVTADTADRYRKATGLNHYLKLLGSSAYRDMRRTLSPLEEDGPLAGKLLRRSQLQTDILVREQEYEILRDTAQRQRMWVEAFVTAWTSRLSEPARLAAVQEAVGDQLADPTYRLHVAEHFGRRWPETITRLFDQIGLVDQKATRFLSASDSQPQPSRPAQSDESVGQPLSDATSA